MNLTHPQPGSRRKRSTSAANWTFLLPPRCSTAPPPSSCLPTPSSRRPSILDQEFLSSEPSLPPGGSGFGLRGVLDDDGLKGAAKLEQHARPRRGGRGRRDSVNSRSPRDRGECSGCPTVTVGLFSPAHGFHASIIDDLMRDGHISARV